MDNYLRKRIKNSFFKALGVKNVSALVEKLDECKSLHKYNKATFDELVYFAESCSALDDSQKKELIKSFKKYKTESEKAKNEVSEWQKNKVNPCTDEPLFSGGFNKDYIIAYLIKDTNTPNCWKIEIEMTNGSHYSRYVDDTNKKRWEEHFQGLSNWI